MDRKQLLRRAPASLFVRRPAAFAQPRNGAQHHCDRASARRALPWLTAVALVAGAVATRTSEPPTAVRPYGYFRSDVAWLVYSQRRYAFLQPKERELWVAPDGSGRLWEEFGPPDFFGPHAHQELGPIYQLPRPTRIDFATGALLPHSNFPTSSESFEMLVSADIAGTRDPHPLAVLRVARSLLAERIAPSSVRSLLLAELLVEAELRRSCAPGAVTFWVEAGSPLVRYSLTLDRTGTLRSDEETLLEADPAIDAVPPVEIGRAVYLATGMVATLDSRVALVSAAGGVDPDLPPDAPGPSLATWCDSR